MTVYFIGAGPGAPDLITVRGLRLIERCPVCLYAGSLVPEEIVQAAPKDAKVMDTAPMHLDQIVEEMRIAHEAGDDDHRQRQHDDLVDPGHDRRQRERQLDLAQDAAGGGAEGAPRLHDLLVDPADAELGQAHARRQREATL